MWNFSGSDTATAPRRGCWCKRSKNCNGQLSVAVIRPGHMLHMYGMGNANVFIVIKGKNNKDENYNESIQSGLTDAVSWMLSGDIG